MRMNMQELTKYVDELSAARKNLYLLDRWERAEAIENGEEREEAINQLVFGEHGSKSATAVSAKTCHPEQRQALVNLTREVARVSADIATREIARKYNLKLTCSKAGA